MQAFLNWVFGKLHREVKLVPVTVTLVIICVLASLYYFKYDRPGFLASAALAQDVSGKLSELKDVYVKGQALNDYNSLEGKISRNAQSSFELQTKIGEFMKAGKDVDGLYYQRQQDLKTERETDERRMLSLMANHPDLPYNH